jgi:hypothetical protein
LRRNDSEGDRASGNPGGHDLGHLQLRDDHGANRVVRGARIEHVCGDPGLGPEKDYAYGMRIVKKALEAVTVPVSGPTLFDPARRPG